MFNRRLTPTVFSPFMQAVLMLCALCLAALTALGGCSRSMPPQVATKPETYAVFSEYRIVSGDVLDLNYMFGASPIEYRINAGDRLIVYFPAASSMRSEQMVRDDGVITIPTVGEIKIAGKTPREAEHAISAKMKRLLRFPEVNIQIVESRSSLAEAVITSGRGSTKQYGVRPDGTLTLPGIGSVTARGKSIETLTAEVNSRYQQLWPTVSVFINLQESQGLQVYVLGEVNRPGNYRITGPSVLPQALSMAGGLTREAAGGVVYIARLENETYEISKVTLGSGFTDSATGRLPLIAPNDIIFVPRSMFSEASQIMQEISSIFLFRGWGMTFNYNLKDQSGTDVELTLP